MNITYKVVKGKPDSRNASFRAVRRFLTDFVREDSEVHNIKLEKNYENSIDNYLRRSWYDFEDVLAVDESNEFVGWMRFYTYDLYEWYVNSRALDISYLYVVPVFRSQGIGSGFIQYAKQEAFKQHIVRVTLQVDSRNKRAQKLYNLCGFFEHERFMECWLHA